MSWQKLIEFKINFEKFYQFDELLTGFDQLFGNGPNISLTRIHLVTAATHLCTELAQNKSSEVPKIKQDE